MRLSCAGAVTESEGRAAPKHPWTTCVTRTLAPVKMGHPFLDLNTESEHPRGPEEQSL